MRIVSQIEGVDFGRSDFKELLKDARHARTTGRELVLSGERESSKRMRKEEAKQNKTKSKTRRYKLARE
jgi:hypothetical protein